MRTGMSRKSLCLWLLGMLMCILPPAIAVISYFPVWVSRGGESVLSGFTVLLLAVCALPLWRAVKKVLSSPSIHTLWLIFFILFLLLSRVAEEMTVISLVGFLSSSLGAILIRLSEDQSKEEE